MAIETKYVKLRKGFDIKLAGKAPLNAPIEYSSEHYSVRADNFVGMAKQKLLVADGDYVKAGQPLFASKENEGVMVTSPISGFVKEVERGDKRKLLGITIKADAEVNYQEFKQYSVSDLANASRDEIVDQLTQSGAWTYIIQRPYGIVARPDVAPKSIFISGFDSAPLSPNYGHIFKNEENSFKAGIMALSKLTAGGIHLSVDADAEIPTIFGHNPQITIHKFSGPHPAGNVGVQIHHIDPIRSGDQVFTISPFGVIVIGRLFLSGKYDVKKVFALSGSELNQPKYVSAISGVNLSGLLEGNIKSDDVRVISGNVLTGTKVGIDGYLGHYDLLVSVLPEGHKQEFLGWILPQTKKISFQRAWGLLSFLNGSNKEYELTTNMCGEERAFVQTGVFEKVTPIDVLPTYLIKAILAKDYDNMEALGLLEVIEEDMALCEFVDVSKNDIQHIIREGLDMLRLS